MTTAKVIVVIFAMKLIQRSIRWDCFMGGSYKNKELFPIGARVMQSHDRISQRVGTVVDYTEDGERMIIHWDDDNYPDGGRYTSELRKVEGR